MNIHDIAQSIRARRRELKITQQALAEKAQLGRSTLNALENGQLPELGASKLLNLLEALGLTLTVTRSENRRPTLDDRYAEQKLAAEKEAVAARPRYRS